MRTPGEAPYANTLNGPTGIFERSVVVHADPDHYKAQRAGNSGWRIACAVTASR